MSFYQRFYCIIPVIYYSKTFKQVFCALFVSVVFIHSISYVFINISRMDKLLGVPYIVTAVGLATLTGGVALAVEYWVPWRTDSVPVSRSTACY